jgi:hypothetical protein
MASSNITTTTTIQRLFKLEYFKDLVLRSHKDSLRPECIPIASLVRQNKKEYQGISRLLVNLPRQYILTSQKEKVKGNGHL